MPGSWAPAGEGQRTVEEVEIATVNSGGQVYAPQAWAGCPVLVIRAPDVWQVTYDHGTFRLGWEGGTQKQVDLDEDADRSIPVYVGKRLEGMHALVALLEA